MVVTDVYLKQVLFLFCETRSCLLLRCAGGDADNEKDFVAKDFGKISRKIFVFGGRAMRHTPLIGGRSSLQHPTFFTEESSCHIKDSSDK